MQAMHRRLIALCSATALLAPGAPAPARSTLTVFAAASLTNAFNALADTLQRRQPGLRIDINYAGSQALALQIEQGAPADVFASADDRWMAVVRDSGWITGESRIFAHNDLVLIVPKRNPARIVRLQDLARDGVKLVVAEDAVPAGHYARMAMATLGQMTGYPSGYSQRVLRNVVSNEDNVKGVVAKVQLGEADAGIVYVSDLTPSVARHVSRIELPEAANPRADYPIAVLRQSRNATMARAFVELVLSPTGQAVLKASGFIPVRAAQ